MGCRTVYGNHGERVQQEASASRPVAAAATTAAGCRRAGARDTASSGAATAAFAGTRSGARDAY